MQSASSFHKLVHSQVITMKTLKEDAQIRRVCVYDTYKPYGRLLLIFQKGSASLDWPCLDTLLLFKLTPLPPSLFDCYGCLRKIRRRHYHINRATGTGRTGNLSSASSMEARSKKNSVGQDWHRTSDISGIMPEGQ